MNLGNTEIKDIADYMGHDERIHVDHYRLPNATKDIMRISNILETASGNKGENFGETSILNVLKSRSKKRPKSHILRNEIEIHEKLCLKMTTGAENSTSVSRWNGVKHRSEIKPFGWK
ncbi:hypothetical protein HHI36_023932 [Cryptolaemus montrouzieri]|uniref:Uncharacterized protein n=1 Tax=Cryptolaemus montrouzieri TaxID=559131 RepID=A0ABD2NP14_9CUCU